MIRLLLSKTGRLYTGISRLGYSFTFSAYASYFFFAKRTAHQTSFKQLIGQEYCQLLLIFFVHSIDYVVG